MSDKSPSDKQPSDEKPSDEKAVERADDAGDVTDDALQTKSAPLGRESDGPFDVSEANPVRPYVDLGGVKILPREGLHLRLEVEEGSKRVVAVALDYRGSTLQVQPFAAPRSTGLWHEIRRQIGDQITKQGGSISEVTSAFGPELLAHIPTVAADGQKSTRIARFIGVDGPRWFLRGVVAGEGAVDAAAGALVDDLFRSVVVVRGSTPMPPRDLIPLHMPGATAAPGAAASAPSGTA